MPNTRRIPEERVALAQHQMEILERRFPNHDCQLYALGSPNCYIFGNNNNYLFQISFRSRSVEILLSIGDEDEEICASREERTIFDYADPKFTDYVISDIIKEWEAAHPPEVKLLFNRP